jgi:hypothetical protein
LEEVQVVIRSWKLWLQMVDKALVGRLMISSVLGDYSWRQPHLLLQVSSAFRMEPYISVRKVWGEDMRR